MNNSYKGGMSSYCLFLLIYSYFKINNKKDINDKNNGFLLMGFLFYYINYIDFNYIIINPSFDNPFIVSNFSIETVPTIIDPSTMKNSGKNIFRIMDVIKALNEIYNDFLIDINEDKDDENVIYKLFNKYSEKGKQIL